MGGRNESGRFANLGYALIRADQQLLCVFAPDHVMIRQRRMARMLFKVPEQIAAIDKQRVRHLLQREFVRAMLFHVGDGGVRQRFAARFFAAWPQAAIPFFFQTGTFSPG